MNIIILFFLLFMQGFCFAAQEQIVESVKDELHFVGQHNGLVKEVSDEQNESVQEVTSEKKSSKKKKKNFLQKLTKYKKEIIIGVGAIASIVAFVYFFNLTKNKISSDVDRENDVRDDTSRKDAFKLVKTEKVDCLKQEGLTCGVHAVFNTLLFATNASQDQFKNEELLKKFKDKAYQILFQKRLNDILDARARLIDRRKEQNVERKKKGKSLWPEVNPYTQEEIEAERCKIESKETLGTGECAFLFFNQELLDIINIDKKDLPDGIIELTPGDDLFYLKEKTADSACPYRKILNK